MRGSSLGGGNPLYCIKKLLAFKKKGTTKLSISLFVRAFNLSGRTFRGVRFESS